MSSLVINVPQDQLLCVFKLASARLDEHTGKRGSVSDFNPSRVFVVVVSAGLWRIFFLPPRSCDIYITRVAFCISLQSIFPFSVCLPDLPPRNMCLPPGSAGI